MPKIIHILVRGLAISAVAAATLSAVGSRAEGALIEHNMVPLSAAPMPETPPATVLPVPTVAPTRVPVPTPAPVPAVAPAPPISSQSRGDDDDMHIAVVGPPMRPLVNEFNAIWPTRGIITTYFGEVGPLSPRGHSGLDIAAPEDTPILAADDGEVLKAYWNDDGYGGLIIIGHPSGYETWYGHLDQFDVEKGQQVRRGQQIALMGSTGFSTGPHLHFEVRQDGQIRDPLDFLNEANLKDADW